MENENNENSNSNNTEQPNLDELDATALKELVVKEREGKTELESNNKQLFERAKKAEGFEKQEDGSWVKTEKVPAKKESKVEKVEDKSDGEFGLLELTFLKGEDIKSEEEIEFVKKELKEAGLSNDNLPKLFANKYFKAQLDEFKTEIANTKATSDVKGGGAGSKATDSPEHWIAKGTPPTKEDVPDRKTRVKIHRAMMKNAGTSGKVFYND